ncbi:MAG: DUF3089 domain-containing protein [Desulfovibrio sp.]|jgi:hypothetical protein|nr:DUF3089 domain-containing protein [Desulfovibrio sp.]
MNITEKPCPVQGDRITPVNYADKNNWLAIPATLARHIDVFFVYPTAWRAKTGKMPLSSVDNSEMRHWATYYLKTSASVFDSCANIFAPCYRQLDTAFAVAQGAEAEQYFYGAPLTDVVAAFDYYITNLNHGRPFILAGHSQGSIMLRGILFNYMKSQSEVYARMIAAYAVGVPFTRMDYANNPHVKAAKSAEDVGVVISYSTEALCVKGVNLLSTPEAVTINPITWTTGDAEAPASKSLGSIIIQHGGTFEKAEHFADAKINPARGTIICSTVNPARFSSSGQSTAYFPLGVLHENDIPLYYYDIRVNAENRIRNYLLRHPKCFNPQSAPSTD